ncbi:N-acetylglucosamine kinase [Robertkochia flava]|uniref:N-acetylglucosamine kinase n=1 Tax=Robertkochia flava TaxID=3447986 RepID=UPI001CCFC4B8|nr:N-acetylglucosamine kinase [Robertkochia marina]
MILVADGGSTKCDWILYNAQTEEKTRFRTRGLNPGLLRKEDLEARLLECAELTAVRHLVKEVYFYGAGCGAAVSQDFLKEIFRSFFQSATRFTVREDILGAVYSCTRTPGVVAILGTGSNCCFYNGSEVEIRQPSLGYMLMDDGSGNHLGRVLLKAFYYNRLPEALAKQLRTDYEVSPQAVRQGVYNSGYPNAYLASFAPFVLENLDHPFMQELTRDVLESFVDTHLGFYKEECSTYPVHFAGSVAYHARPLLSEILEAHGMMPGNFIRRPIEGLLEYHLHPGT